MNYQVIMQLIDFSPLFQLVFTLYGAFIAIEYAKSFTALVIRRFYNFQGEIKTKIDEIKNTCRQDEMLSIESDDFYKNGRGLCLVDEYKQKYKECEDLATKIEEDLKEYVEKNTEYRIFRHISIFFMLFSFALLVSGGFYRVYPSQTIHFVLSFIAITSVFVFIGWFCASIRATQTWSEKISFIVVGSLYLLSVFLSFLALDIHLSLSTNIKTLLWTIGIIIAVMLPYLNFVFFFFLVTIQMNKIRAYCEQSYRPLKQQCSDAGDLMEKIINHKEMENKINENDQKEKHEDG